MGNATYLMYLQDALGGYFLDAMVEISCSRTYPEPFFPSQLLLVPEEILKFKLCQRQEKVLFWGFAAAAFLVASEGTW